MGRWDEAAQLLRQQLLQEFCAAKKLASQLAEQLLQRAGNHIAEGDSLAGWHDLQQATQLGGRDEAIAALRDAHYQVAFARQGPTTVRFRKVAMANARTYQQQSGRRLVAWIDTVGGYLLCLGDEISLGQMSPHGAADIPFLADLSRRHAVIRRTGESYVMTPIHLVRVDGVKLAGPVVLRDRALLQLGDTVQLRFCRPHALSATALLIPESHHRIEPAVDAIVLMSDSCILGPQEHSHIRCRHWPGDLVLVRRGEQLRAHTEMPLEVNGQPYDPQSCIVGNGRLENDTIGLSIEELQ